MKEGGVTHCGDGRVHDLPVSGLAALHVDVDAERVEDEEELAVGQLHRAERVHRAVGEEAEHLVVRVDQGCRGEEEKGFTFLPSSNAVR